MDRTYHRGVRVTPLTQLAVALTTVLAVVAVPSADSAFSGANGEIAFSIVLPNTIQGVEGDSRDIDIDICTIRPESPVRRRITGPGSQSLWSNAPAWSASGAQLAFMATGGFSPGVDVASADGRSRKIVLPRGRAPTWAPSGGELAFVSHQGQIAVLRLSDGAQRVVAARGDQPAWSPDGSRIAYVVDQRIAVIGADGSSGVVLTSGPGIHASPNWSPDGRRIVFVAQADESSEPTIEMINADGSGRNRLASVRRTGAFPSPAFVDPTWSPDGAKIAFVQRQDGGDATDVYVMRADGTEVVNLTRSPFYESSIDWRPLAGAALMPASTASCGISGTGRGEKLAGTGMDDVVYALAGNDTISTGGAEDIVLAGEGNDRIALGSGSDLALGAAGNDRTEAGDGSDAVYGESGIDALFGQGGADELQGGTGNDLVNGGAGDDLIIGGAGNDRLTGGPGRDVISGGDGNDSVSARDRERDTITCGRGRDVVQADRQDRVSRDCERIIRKS